MTDTDPGAATAGGRLVEAAKKGGRAVTRAAGKVADVALSVVRRGGSGSSSGGDETAAAVRDAAHGDLELVRRTAAGETQREAARQAAEGAAEFGGLYAGLLEEQLRHNRQAVAALGRAVSVDWDEVVRAQGEFVRASLERLARLNDRHLEVVRAAMAAASAVGAGTRPGGPPEPTPVRTTADSPSEACGRGREEPGEDVTLVLGGGHALGAYQAGAYEAAPAAGLRPGRVVGSSTGAITAAILAGNPPERRLERLRQYWGEAAQAGAWPAAPPLPAGPTRDLYNATHAALALALGRPGIHRPRLPGPWRLAAPWAPGEVALHDHAPLRGTLERLVDFDLLNRVGAAPRLSVGCVDVETGEEVWFDSAEGRIGPEHVLASGALMPHFPPVEVGGRLLCDPGYVNNMPVDRALAEPPGRDLLCLAVELFGLRGARPASLDAAAGRVQDMVFAGHAARHVAALRREHALRARLEGPGGPAVTLVRPAWPAARPRSCSCPPTAPPCRSSSAATTRPGRRSGGPSPGPSGSNAGTCSGQPRSPSPPGTTCC